MDNKDLKEPFINALAKAIASIAKPFYCCYKRHSKNYKNNHAIQEDNNINNNRNFRLRYTVFSIVALIVVSVLIFYSCPNCNNSVANIDDIVIEEVSVYELTGEDLIIHNDILLSLKDFSTVCISGYEIISNNNRVAFVKEKETAEYILKSLKDKYRINDQDDDDENEHEKIEIVKCYFEQDVNIQKTFLPVLKALPIEDTQKQLERIIKGTIEQKRHVVEKGESFWVIAKGYGIPVDTLIAANPDLNPKTLQIGQVISLVVPRPLISVYTVYISEYDEPVPYDVIYEDTKTMFQGEYKVKVKGTKGKKHIKAEIYNIDGLEAGRIILDEKFNN